MSPAVQLRLILPSVTRLDLDEDERDALLSTLRAIVDNDRFPLSPRGRRKPPGEPSTDDEEVAAANETRRSSWRLVRASGHVQ